MLPDLIEIVSATGPVRAEISAPGSKSITNRALILAALAQGEVTLAGALWSEDTQIMANCLQELGFEIHVRPDPGEFCNRIITIKGLAGKIPNGGTDHAPLDLHVGNAGTAARFLSALLCLGGGVYRLSGVPRMHERPQAELFHALRQLGYRIEPERRDDRLPARIFGQGPKSGKCSASIQESSQFASALLLCRKAGGWEVQVTGENAEESPYVAMTSKMTEAFPYHGGTFQIEPDASSGSYFRAADWLFAATSDGFGKITVRNWPKSGWQIDAAFPAFLPLPESISRNGQLGDSIMTAIVLAADERTERGPRAHGKREKIHFTDLDRLRVQECDRVLALRTELRKCGAKIVEKGDTLTIHPSQLHGSEIETYNDHRMAMCFAILGLKIPGIKIKNPACVKKTFPNFFQKLAAAPPTGLGVSILEADTGRPLRLEELFAH